MNDRKALEWTRYMEICALSPLSAISTFCFYLTACFFPISWTGPLTKIYKVWTSRGHVHSSAIFGEMHVTSFIKATNVLSFCTR